MQATELDDLRQTVREFLTLTSSADATRTLMATDTGYDEAVWRQLAGELGLCGIGVPEEWGGAGSDMTALAVVFEEMGSALLCAPFFSTVALATQALLGSGDREAIEEFVPSIVDGTTTATLILNGRLDPWDPGAVTLTARAGDDYHVSGSADMVLDGHTADVILLSANTTEGISLLAVQAEAAGLQRELLASLDRTRKVARLRFDEVPARLVGSDGAASTCLARTSNLAIVALAAEQVGAAQRCLDTAVGYAKDRIQFGRAIGSFQAIKHRCADMLVLVEGARSAAMHAAEVAETDELPIAAAVAKMACSEAFLRVALDNMRIHGGIGFTWEHDGHLYARRAKSSQLTFGSPDFHAQRLAELVAPSIH